jgi:hypothetical protein
MDGLADALSSDCRHYIVDQRMPKALPESVIGAYGSQPVNDPSKLDAAEAQALKATHGEVLPTLHARTRARHAPRTLATLLVPPFAYSNRCTLQLKSIVQVYRSEAKPDFNTKI